MGAVRTRGGRGAVELAARGRQRALGREEVGGHRGVGRVVVVLGDRKHATRRARRSARAAWRARRGRSPGSGRPPPEPCTRRMEPRKPACTITMPQFRCWPGPTSAAWRTSRPHSLLRPMIRARCAAVRDILAEVRARGDAALRDFTERFDGCRLDDLRVPNVGAQRRPRRPLARRPRVARLRARRDRRLPRGPTRRWLHPRPRRHPPHRAVVPVTGPGCYVPGGRAAYPSTRADDGGARLASPASTTSSLCVPPGPDGTVPAVTLAAAALAGVDEVYRVGGAQAIAAMAYGTESIRAVDVIVGPGNVYVALAKREVAGCRRDRRLRRTVGGRDRRRRHRALHGGSPPTSSPRRSTVPAAPPSCRPGTSPSPTRSTAPSPSCSRTRRNAPRSRQRSRATGRIVLVDDVDAACAAIDVLAPEHLELAVRRRREARRRSAQRRCDLRGQLRTGRARRLPRRCEPRAADGAHRAVRRARCASTRSASTCTSWTSTRPRSARVAPAVATLAEVEGLVEHARSVTIRRTQS